MKIARAGVLWSLIAWCLIAIPLRAQAIPEIDNLSKRAAESVAKTHRQHIFVFSHLNCQLDAELCTDFEVSLRDSLEKMSPNVQFVRREDVVNLLPSHGFISLDVYVNDVLELVAPEAGAEIVVTDSLGWRSDGYQLTSEVIDAEKKKRLDRFQIKIERPVPPGEIPLLVRDQDSGVTSLIYRETLPLSSPYHAQCDKCPDPTYTAEARNDNIQGTVVMLATVTEQGEAEHISVIKGLKDGLTARAVETVGSWHFKPAVGADGKPIATRVPIQITFILRK
jgi:TonB family protein